MVDFWIKKDDLRPNIEATLEDENNNAVDLSNASSVDFHMKKFDSSSTKVDSSATITDAANGKVEYEWSSGDTDTAGDYIAEFEVMWSDSDPETYPNFENLHVRVFDEVA